MPEKPRAWGRRTLGSDEPECKGRCFVPLSTSRQGIEAPSKLISKFQHFVSACDNTRGEQNCGNDRLPNSHLAVKIGFFGRPSQRLMHSTDHSRTLSRRFSDSQSIEQPYNSARTFGSASTAGSWTWLARFHTQPRACLLRCGQVAVVPWLTRSVKRGSEGALALNRIRFDEGPRRGRERWGEFRRFGSLCSLAFQTTVGGYSIRSSVSLALDQTSIVSTVAGPPRRSSFWRVDFIGVGVRTPSSIRFPLQSPSVPNLVGDTLIGDRRRSATSLATNRICSKGCFEWALPSKKFDVV